MSQYLNAKTIGANQDHVWVISIIAFQLSRDMQLFYLYINTTLNVKHLYKCHSLHPQSTMLRWEHNYHIDSSNMTALLG